MELRGLIFGWLVTTDNALIGLIDETERDACTMVFFPFFFYSTSLLVGNILFPNAGVYHARVSLHYDFSQSSATSSKNVQ